MLEMRRIIEFSSRAHTYLLSLYTFFAFLFVLFLYYPVQESFVTVITWVQMVMGWTLFFVGLWIIISSIICSLCSRVLIIGPIIKTFLRFALYFVISVSLDLVNTLIKDGFSYGG